VNMKVAWQHCVVVLVRDKLKQSALLKLFIEELLNIWFVLFYRQTVQCKISTSDSNRVWSVSYRMLENLNGICNFFMHCCLMGLCIILRL
jgi:hypothetical protein